MGKAAPGLAAACLRSGNYGLLFNRDMGMLLGVEDGCTVASLEEVRLNGNGLLYSIFSDN